MATVTGPMSARGLQGPAENHGRSWLAGEHAGRTMRTFFDALECEELNDLLFVDPELRERFVVRVGLRVPRVESSPRAARRDPTRPPRSSTKRTDQGWTRTSNVFLWTSQHEPAATFPRS